MKRAFLDANVLFSAHLRDVLLWLAFRRVYEARFSAIIHEEWMRAVLKQRPQTNLESLQKTRDAMNRNIPGALIEGFEPLIATLTLPDENDRHVLAAAIHSRCDVIITFNLSNFPLASRAPFSIALQTPDAFLSELFQLDPQNVLASLHAQRLNLQKPPLEVAAFMANLRNQNLPHFTAALEPFQLQLCPPAAQYAQKREEAIELIREHAPTRLQEPLIELLRPAIALAASRADDAKIPLGASKFGGAPDVPPDFLWPMWNDKPLGFLAQINLEEVAAFPN